jgi:hypothetical protein
MIVNHTFFGIFQLFDAGFGLPLLVLIIPSGIIFILIKVFFKSKDKKTL